MLTVASQGGSEITRSSAGRGSEDDGGGATVDFGSAVDEVVVAWRGQIWSKVVKVTTSSCEELEDGDKV